MNQFSMSAGISCNVGNVESFYNSHEVFSNEMCSINEIYSKKKRDYGAYSSVGHAHRINSTSRDAYENISSDDLMGGSCRAKDQTKHLDGFEPTQLKGQIAVCIQIRNGLSAMLTTNTCGCDLENFPLGASLHYDWIFSSLRCQLWRRNICFRTNDK